MPDVPIKPRRRRRPLFRLVRGVVLVYLGLCAAAYFGQDYLAFPGHGQQGKPESAITFGSRGTVLRLTTADGTPVAAAYGVACDNDGTRLTDPTTRPTVLYFYGNGSSAAWSESEFDHFRRLGVNVVVPDYPGFGASGGKVTEAGFYAAADAAYDYAVRAGATPDRIVAVGWSLGGAVAIDLASRRPVAAVATFNAFTTMPDMAGQLLPWIPGRYLIRYRFDNLRKIADVHAPTLICNGSLDTLVPAWMADRLAAAAGGPVTRLTVPTADHNTIFTADPAAVWGALRTLLETVEKRK